MQVNPGTWYVVTTDSECTVTDANGKTLCTAVAGEQKPFLATTMEVTLSDEGATVTRTTFKHAALALGLFGGGVTSSLPAGYTLLEFLESKGGQYINTGVNFSLAEDCEWEVKAYKTVNNSSYHHILGYRQTVDGGKICLGASYSSTSGELELEMGKKSYRGYNIDTSVPLEIRANNQVASANGSKITINNTQFGLPINNISIFRRYDISTSMLVGRVYWVNIYNGGRYVMKVVPALSKTGVPCMYDVVNKTPYYNSGSGAFIAGFTLAQARKLGKLPAGTKLTISLPVGWQEDEGVVEALAQAEANGCVLTYQEYDAVASAAATYALRRIWVKRTQEDNGSYVDANNTRWQIDWCVGVIGADPESLGYERFRSVEVAAEYWEMVPYEYPEELSTEA